MSASFILLVTLSAAANLFVVYKLFEIEDYLKRRDRDDPQNAPTEIIPVRKRRK
jgi:hypothetical protein